MLIRSITKILGDWWANLDEPEKVSYTQLAKEVKFNKLLRRKNFIVNSDVINSNLSYESISSSPPSSSLQVLFHF